MATKIPKHYPIMWLPGNGLDELPGQWTILEIEILGSHEGCWVVETSDVACIAYHDNILQTQHSIIHTHTDCKSGFCEINTLFHPQVIRSIACHKWANPLRSWKLNSLVAVAHTPCYKFSSQHLTPLSATSGPQGCCGTHCSSPTLVED